MNPEEAKRRIRLAKIGGLTKLYISSCGLAIPPIELKEIGKELTHLNIASNRLGAYGAKLLADYCPNLISLNIGRGYPWRSSNLLFAEGAKAIASLTDLVYLDISDNGIGDEGALALDCLKQLTVLNIAKNCISGIGAQALARLYELAELDMNRNELVGADIIPFTALARLTKFDCSFNDIGDAGAEALSVLTSLKILNVEYSDMTNAGAKVLSSLASLDELTIYGNKFNDEGAEHIAKISTLTKLYYPSEQIGEKGAIALSALKNLTHLGVGYNKEIGPDGAKAIASLAKLKHLNIASAGIKEEGARAIARLSDLEYLNIRSNGIGPGGAIAISRLNKLSELEIDENWIRLEGIKAVATLSNLKVLDVSDLSLGDEGVEELRALSSLTSLNVKHSTISARGAQAIASLTELTALNMSGNKIGAEGAKVIAVLPNLKKLEISANDLGVEGAREIGKSPVLEYLDIRSNGLGSDGAAVLSELKYLINLQIDNNQIGPKGALALASLVNLKELSLSYNSIGDEGAKALKPLIQLTKLDIDSSSYKQPEIKFSTGGKVYPHGRSRLRKRFGAFTKDEEDEMPPKQPTIDRNPIGDAGAKAIGSLKNLCELNLLYNKVGNEGAIALSKLSNLRRLVLGGNQIGSAGAVAIGSLSGLDDLQIWKNGITNEGAKAIAELPILRGLGISDNFIGEEGLRALAFSPSLMKAKYSIRIENNGPTDIPDEIAKDIDKLRSYFTALSYGKAVGKSARVVLCGNTLAGKTSLATKLDNFNNDNPLPFNRTHGIKHWQPSELNDRTGMLVNIWDFGGQDYFHATHAAALHTGDKVRDNIHTLYCLLWRSADPEVIDDSHQQMSLDYWLGFTDSVAGLNASIEIVQTHADLDPPAKYPFDSKILKEGLFNLSDNKHYLSLNSELLYSFSSRERKLWDNFTEAIVALIKNKAQSQQYPTVWEKIRRIHLAEISGKKQPEGNLNVQVDHGRHLIRKHELRKAFLDSAALSEIAPEERENALQYDELLDYLRRCGEVLFWKSAETNDEALLEYVVIDVQQFHEVIYNDLLSDEVKQNGGRFMATEKLAFYVKYLVVNDLVFKEDLRGDYYIAPQYLPLPQRTRLVSKYLNVHLHMRFPYYMPRYLISRFIVIANRIGNNVSYWKYDCECEIDGVDLVVSVNIKKQQVTMYTVDAALKNNLLQKLVYYFGSFGECNPWGVKADDFFETEPEIMQDATNIPLNRVDKFLQLSVDDETFFEVNELRNMNAQIARSANGVNLVVPDLIAKTMINKTSKMHNIFISYSKDDLDILRELEVAFAALKRQNKINLWTDGQIEAGKDWDIVIKQQLNQADTVLCLISPGLIANNYVMDVELPLAKAKLGDDHVIPLFTTSADVEGLDFDRWQGLLTIKQYPKPIDEKHCQNGLYWLRNIPKKHRDIYYTAIVKELRKRYRW